MNAPKSTPTPAISVPLKLSLIDGEVVFLGAGLGFSMTRAAAAETAAHLAALLRGANARAGG